MLSSVKCSPPACRHSVSLEPRVIASVSVVNRLPPGVFRPCLYFSRHRVTVGCHASSAVIYVASRSLNLRRACVASALPRSYLSGYQ